MRTTPLAEEKRGRDGGEGKRITLQREPWCPFERLYDAVIG
jgi:hypothetical protein